MEKEEADRLTLMFGTCPTCGAPLMDRVRWVAADERMEEIVCSAVPDYDDEPHSSGMVLLDRVGDF